MLRTWLRKSCCALAVLWYAAHLYRCRLGTAAAPVKPKVVCTKLGRHRAVTVRRAGVSNFNLEQLIELVEWASIPPAVVQRHANVFEQDVATHRFCLSQGIRYTAYSSLGMQYLRLGFAHSPVVSNGAVQAIAAAHGLSPAQVRLCAAPRTHPIPSSHSCLNQPYRIT